jgi:hypothetical protein
MLGPLLYVSLVVDQEVVKNVNICYIVDTHYRTVVKLYVVILQNEGIISTKLLQHVNGFSEFCRSHNLVFMHILPATVRYYTHSGGNRL